jgi:hypothetical protein
MFICTSFAISHCQSLLYQTTETKWIILLSELEQGIKAIIQIRESAVTVESIKLGKVA